MARPTSLADTFDSFRRPAAVCWAVPLGRANHQSEYGEPFVWTEGISLWPTVLVRFIATVLAFTFVFFLGLRSYRPSLNFLRQSVPTAKTPGQNKNWESDVLHHRIEWGANFEIPPKTANVKRPSGWRAWYADRCRGILKWRLLLLPFIPSGWNCSTDENSVVCKHYTLLAWGWAQGVRSVIFAIAYIVCAVLNFWFWDAWPNCPFRGGFSYAVCILILMINIFAVCWLVFYVVDAIFCCQRFVRVLGDKPRRWPESTIKLLALSNLRDNSEAPMRKPENGEKAPSFLTQQADREALEELVTIRLIGRHTNKLLKTVPISVRDLVVDDRGPQHDL